MIIIRPLGPHQLQQVLHLLAQHSQMDFEYSALETLKQLYIPIHQVSQLLPARHQFVPAIYVATAHNKVLGLIWLTSDEAQNRRWKIDQLIIDPDESTYDIGTQLIQYVISRYGADGVQTFLAFADQQDNIALGLLKSVGFRFCTRLHTFCLEPGENRIKAPSIKGLRESVAGDRYRLAALYNDALPPETRTSLSRTPLDYKRCWGKHLSKRLRGVWVRQWVVEDLGRDVILAEILLSHVHHNQYRLNLVINQGRADLLEPCLAFAIAQVQSSSLQARVTLPVFDFNKPFLASLAPFECISTADVLVKDYWMPLSHNKPRLSSPILLRHISPA
jgi:ribosomal protein S18 acetylase RimI-like enzyme